MKIAKRILPIAFIAGLTVTALASTKYTYYQSSVDTTGGTNGHIKVSRQVYKEINTYGGNNVYYYGVEGVVNTASTITATWTGYGTLYKVSDSDYLSSTTSNANSYSRYKGVYNSDPYVTFSLHLDTYDAAFGTSTYYRNGAF